MESRLTIKDAGIETQVVDGMPDSDYRKVDAACQSGLKILKRHSPAHMREALANPFEPTPATRRGNLVHALILEPKSVAARFALAPDCDRRTKAGKQIHEDFIAEAADRIIVCKDEWDQAHAMAESIFSHSVAGELASRGIPERSLFWNDPQTGVACKARLDYHRDNMVVDLKTTACAAFSEFQRSSFNYGYHFQAAFYLDALEAIEGATDREFVIIAVEDKSPYAVAVYFLDEMALDYGRMEYREALDKYSECLRMGHWPAYETTVKPLTLPKWVA